MIRRASDAAPLRRVTTGGSGNNNNNSGESTLTLQNVSALADDTKQTVLPSHVKSVVSRTIAAAALAQARRFDSSAYDIDAPTPPPSSSAMTHVPQSSTTAFDSTMTMAFESTIDVPFMSTSEFEQAMLDVDSGGGGGGGDAPTSARRNSTFKYTNSNSNIDTAAATNANNDTSTSVRRYSTSSGTFSDRRPSATFDEFAHVLAGMKSHHTLSTVVALYVRN